MRHDSQNNRICRSLSGDIYAAFKNAALEGVKNLDYLWRHSNEEQRKEILKKDSLIELLHLAVSQVVSQFQDGENSLDEGNTQQGHIDIDQNIREYEYGLQNLSDLLLWFNERVHNKQQLQEICLEAFFYRRVPSEGNDLTMNAVKFFMLKNDVEALDLIKQNVDDKVWNDELKKDDYSLLVEVTERLKTL